MQLTNTAMQMTYLFKRVTPRDGQEGGGFVGEERGDGFREGAAAEQHHALR